MQSYRLLDLFCGGGGAGMGFYRAGFHVVGVDIAPHPHYPFQFWQDDALHVLECLVRDGHWQYETFDAVHASPPCQGYLNLTRLNETLGRENGHGDLIGPVRDALKTTGLPYVIENVQDARAALRDPIRLCGSSFGLGVRRHRLFECSFPVMAPPCAHHLQTERRYWTSARPNGEHRLSTVVQVYGNGAGAEHWPEAMDIGWMTRDELREAIPPAYTEHIGAYLMAELKAGERLAG